MDASEPPPAALPAGLAIAVLIPCFNEEAAIGTVVRDFRAAGAVVRSKPLQGKGNVVRRMFADIEADIYVLVDGDDTYDAASAPVLIGHLLAGSLDMVNAARSPGTEAEAAAAFRRGHRFGNRLLTGLVAAIFGSRIKDMLSGYRIFSRRFVKLFPALARGFEIETELTVHALELRLPIAELPAPFRHRPAGSVSKLSTLRDGLRILHTILVLVKEERPLQFFSLIFAVLALTAIGLAWPLVVTFMATGLVPRLPTAILATGMMLAAFLSLACGLILDTVTRGRKEIKRMRYLGIPAPAAPEPGDRPQRGAP